MRKSSFPNIVGYQTVEVPASSTVILACQFGSCDQPLTNNIADICTMPDDDRRGGNALSTATDQMWVWDPATSGWVKYFWRKQGLNTIGWCKEKTTTVTKDKIISGQGVFFKRPGGAPATTLTCSGAVVPLSNNLSIAIPASSTKILCNPWPVPFALKDLINCIPADDQRGANALSTATDQAWLWENSAWEKYFLRKQGLNTIGWCKEKTTTVTPKTLNPGQGFFFKRPGGAPATTFTFTKPTEVKE